MSATAQKLGMPKWGLSMTEGRVLEWLVDEGAEVHPGDEVAEIETDKLTGPVESPLEGVLRRRVAAEGDVVPVGGLLGVVADPEVPDADIDAFVADFQASFVPGETEEDAGPAPETVEVAAGSCASSARATASRSCSCTASAATSSSGSWRCRRSPIRTRRSRSTYRATAGRPRTWGAGTSSAAVEQFLDAIEVGPAHLVGHSMGGLVAGVVALRSPERVRSLTLIDSAGLGEEVDPDYLDGFVDAESRRELKPVLEMLFADTSQVTRRLVDDVLKYKRIDGVTESLRTLRDGVLAGEHIDLDELDAPVLVIWGAKDRIIAQPAGELRVIESSGHSPHLESAAEVNELIREFVNA